MKIFNRLIAAAALALLVLSIAPSASFAGGAFMCAPDPTGASTGPRRFTNLNNGNTYGLNSAGCAYMALADIGYAQSQGFTYGFNGGSIVFNTGVATGTTDFVIGSVPANAYIQQVIYSNSTANAVTGNLTLGTTANGTDVVAAANMVCGANCLAPVANANIAKQVFSLTAPTALHLAAVTAWNSANVTITVIYGYF
jgi:hypothetical protein